MEKEYLFEVIGHDYNSPLFRNYCFIKAFMRYGELMKLVNPLMSVVSTKNDIEYAGNSKSWFGLHEQLKIIVEKDYSYVGKLIDETNRLGEEFNKWSEKNIFNEDLGKKSDEELMDLIDEFVDRQSKMYAYGIVLPTLDFNEFSFVEGNVKKFLEKAIINEKERNEAYNILTWPAFNSFAQEQEEDLLKLMDVFYSAEWKKDIEKKDLNEIKKLYPKFYDKLVEHTKKYCWVYYVYAGPAFNEKDFLEFIKQYLEKNKAPKDILFEMHKNREEMKIKKNEIIKKLKPEGFDKYILEFVGKFVWAKPRRKDYQSRSYYHAEKLLKEIARRLYLTLEQIRACPVPKMREYLLKGEADVNYLNSIHNYHICYTDMENNKPEVLHGKEAEKFVNINVKKKNAGLDVSGIKEIKGSCACSGKARGRVKIVNNAGDMHKMESGDILVSKATTPSIVSAMKKASAIVTDEGGLTCHAAIVSRELNTPCVVGLKFATLVFKDGDLIEVDADKGIVRKI